MIEFDYEIERDEGDEIRKYYPDKISSPLSSSTAYIEGPNSSGKSTLLHLIALGFHGLEDEDLARPLREKLEDLIKNDKIVFDVKINDNKGKPILQAKKPDKENGEIKTYLYDKDNIKPINSELFKEKYKLIYDIPDNPTERIEKIADEVKYYQTSISNNISNYNNYVREVLTDITEGRDPERIEKVQTSLEGQKSNIIIKKNQMITDKREFELMCRYAYPYLLEHYTSELSGIDSEMSRIKTSVASKRKAKGSSKSQYDEKVKKISTIIGKTQNEYREASSYLKTIMRGSENEKILNSEWYDVDFVKIRTEYKVPVDFMNTLDKVLKIVEKVYSKNKIAEQNANVYSQIIETLQKATYNKVKMPEIGITLNDFIDRIDILKNETEAQSITAKNARKAKDHLNQLYAYMNSLRIEHFPNLIKLSDKVGLDSQGRTDDSEVLRMEQGLLLKRRKIKAIVEEYKHKCAKYGVSEFEHATVLREQRKDVEKYLKYTEKQLSDELEYLEEENKKSEKQFEMANLRIERDEVELDRLKNRKPHKYEEKKEIIEEIMNYLGSLNRKFLNTFSKALDSYKNKKNLPNPSNFPEDHDNTKKYYEGVSNYLGAKLGTIRHIDGEYEVKKVNLVSGNVTTESGKKIRLRAMGTGQTQSTYLQSKLKTDYDGRKLIVMFDEVGMMDDNSMEPIKNLIKKLKNEGTLLVGLVVQRLDSGVKITPI